MQHPVLQPIGRAWINLFSRLNFEQDLFYWVLYVFLRPNRNWHLVSYPYYTKYDGPGDSTFFQHIDINVRSCSTSGCSAAIIEGSSIHSTLSTHRVGPFGLTSGRSKLSDVESCPLKLYFRLQSSVALDFYGLSNPPNLLCALIFRISKHRHNKGKARQKSAPGARLKRRVSLVSD